MSSHRHRGLSTYTFWHKWRTYICAETGESRKSRKSVRLSFAYVPSIGESSNIDGAPFSAIPFDLVIRIADNAYYARNRSADCIAGSTSPIDQLTHCCCHTSASVCVPDNSPDGIAREHQGAEPCS